MVANNYEPKNSYLVQDKYTVKSQDNNYQQPMLYFNPDLAQQSINPDTGARWRNVTDRVFGSEIRQNYLNLKNVSNLLYERSKLHNQHIYDIDHRHLDIQGKLFGVNINNFPDKAKRQAALEKDLLQLEQQRRDEELAFWNDSAEIRQKMLDSEALYNTAKDRFSLFSDVENNGTFLN